MSWPAGRPDAAGRLVVLLGRATDVPLDDDALDDLAGNGLEELEDDVVDAATAARTVAELDTEIAILTDLELIARRVRYAGTDCKWTELRALLQDNSLVRDAAAAPARWSCSPNIGAPWPTWSIRSGPLLGRDDEVVAIHGGIRREERRIFRLRTLAASNLSGLKMGGAIFSQFFLLTLYMQQVLHYSALKTGVANISLTLSIVMFSAISQALVTRIGIRPVLPVGLALSTAALVLFAQLPVHGDYFSDLFPELLLSGVGLALAFVPMSIGALTGVPPGRRGHRLRTDQHQPADRRRDRRRARAHRRDHGHQSLRPGARRHHCVHRGRAHPRV